MSMSDPLGDMLTRIRNGQHARKTVVSSPSSRFRTNVLEVLKREGYIRNYSSVDVRPGIKELQIELKYHEGEPVISEIKRVSRPGRRVYYGLRDLPRVYNGLGIAILSTPRGVLLTMRRAQPRLAAKSSVTYFKERLACLVSEVMRLPFLLM